MVRILFASRGRGSRRGVPEHPAETGAGLRFPHPSTQPSPSAAACPATPSPPQKPAGAARTQPTSTHTNLYSQLGWISPRCHRRRRAPSSASPQDPIVTGRSSRGCGGQLCGAGSGGRPRTPAAQAPSHPIGRDDALQRVRASPLRGWTEPCKGPGQPRCSAPLPPSQLPGVCSSSAAPHDGDKGEGPLKSTRASLGNSWRGAGKASPRQSNAAGYLPST